MLKNESMMSESLNSSSSVGDNIMKSGNDSDFVRATAEVRELREEGSQLRQENIELKVCTFITNVLVNCVIQYLFVYFRNKFSD